MENVVHIAAHSRTLLTEAEIETEIEVEVEVARTWQAAVVIVVVRPLQFLQALPWLLS